MLQVNDIIKTCHNYIFKIVNINENCENPYFKYELKAIDEDATHNYFMSDDDIKKYNVRKINFEN